MAIRKFIPEEFIQLHLETQHHPLLMQRLQKHPAGEIELVLAETAAYCDIAVDGEFTHDDLVVLAALCLQKLQKTSRPRSSIILPSGDEDWSHLITK